MFPDMDLEFLAKLQREVGTRKTNRAKETETQEKPEKHKKNRRIFHAASMSSCLSLFVLSLEKELLRPSSLFRI